MIRRFRGLTQIYGKERRYEKEARNSRTTGATIGGTACRATYTKILHFIQSAKKRAYQAVNIELVSHIRLAIREKWSSRELERQLRAALFEPEHLDRDYRKPHENPSIGQLLTDTVFGMTYEE